MDNEDKVLPEGITETMPVITLSEIGLREKRAYVVDDYKNVKFYWYDPWARNPYTPCSILTPGEIARLANTIRW